jgi:hypothetical protein
VRVDWAKLEPELFVWSRVSLTMHQYLSDGFVMKIVPVYCEFLKEIYIRN